MSAPLHYFTWLLMAFRPSRGWRKRDRVVYTWRRREDERDSITQFRRRNT